MRVVIQRVSHASVTIDGHCKSAIQKGMMILVGIEETDSREVTYWLLANSHYMRLLKKEIVHPT